MSVSKAKIKASAKYNAKTYVNMALRVKPRVKQEIDAHAAAVGESVAGFIVRACYETMERDKLSRSEGGE